MRILTKKIFITFTFCLSFLFLIPFTSFADPNINSSTKANNYPIVMVHGLFGWGNDEYFGKNYWGGKFSLRQDLVDKGYEVYTPTIGSVSSNWDRACELYAYIKGGTADYGEAHSKKYGHSRYGRTYPGICKDWGTTDSSGQVKKIHLIGHSMGGETIRLLVQLLENGDQQEQSATTGNSMSPLFTGNKHWVDSVTTIATPEDGSAEASVQEALEPLTHQFIATLAAETSPLNSNNPCFDYRLDQWGLKKLPSESYADYNKKVLNSSIWKKCKDFSLEDLTPEGAKNLNSWVKAQNDVYYFSYSCSDTHKDLLTSHQVPNGNMSNILLKSSTFIGMYTSSKPNAVKITKDWWENDGVVSVRSAICPHEGSNDKVVNYNFSTPNPQKGVWNYLGKIDNVDHLQVVQMDKNRNTLESKYFDLAKMLSNLPK